MYYLKKFDTHHDYLDFVGGVASGFVEPCTSICVAEDDIHFDPIPIPNYLCLTALEDTTFTITIPSGMTTTDLSLYRYSLNGYDWETLENVDNTEVSITTPKIKMGRKIYLKGNGTCLGKSATVYSNVSSTGKFDVSGNIASLIYEDTFETFYSAPRVSFIFGNFFRNSKVVHAGKLILPVKQQYYTYNLYSNLFQDCTELIECAPVTFASASSTWLGAYKGCTSLEVPPVFTEGLTLGSTCFSEMFSGCISLRTAPVLPYTTLSIGCYNRMFDGCTSLTTAPELPAMNLANQCYAYMFGGCKNLISPPNLPATTATDRCYCGMFIGCSNLKILPNISITTLANQCYIYMFQQSGIETIPSGYLPNTSLTNGCYYQMFYGCGKLTDVPENLLPATTLSTSCYSSMFAYCPLLESGPKLPAETLVSECYYQMFRNCNSMKYIKMYATDIAASNCLSGWLAVPKAGIIVKHIDATWTTTGQSGVPTNWTVIYYDPSVDKYYLDQGRATECDDHGNPLTIS